MYAPSKLNLKYIYNKQTKKKHPHCYFRLSFLTVLLSFAGMLPVLLLAGLILALSIPGNASESATLRFLGQTEFVVDESSTAVVRLVVERVGDPVNVTALVLVRHGERSPSMTHCAPTLIGLSSHFFCLFSDHLAVLLSSVPAEEENK